jgi:hypothetical protein
MQREMASSCGGKLLVLTGEPVAREVVMTATVIALCPSGHGAPKGDSVVGRASMNP